jgi:hypothetical protein
MESYYCKKCGTHIYKFEILIESGIKKTIERMYCSTCGDLLYEKQIVHER